jgi:2-dehydropantoate 2-reductase
MRILFFGAGAIGTYIGGSLAAAGHAVTFIERPQPADVIRARGLRVRRGAEPETIRSFSMVTSPEEALAAGPYDFGVFALKSFDTGSALEELRAAAHLPPSDTQTSVPVPPLLCFQNGVDNEAEIARSLGADHVIAGTVTTAVGKPGLGEAVVERRRGVGVALGHPLSGPIVQALNQARLNARPYPEAAPMKWSKLLTNLIGNATSAILDLPVAGLFADRRLFALEIAVLRECLRVMRAQGLSPVDLPGTPVRALALAVEHLPRAAAQPILARAVGAGRGGKMPSFHIDLHGGRGQTEVRWLNGAVVAHGARLGVAAPVNRVLTDTLEAISAGRLDKEQFRQRPESLLRLINV